MLNDRSISGNNTDHLTYDIYICNISDTVPETYLCHDIDMMKTVQKCMVTLLLDSCIIRVRVGIDTKTLKQIKPYLLTNIIWLLVKL